MTAVLATTVQPGEPAVRAVLTDYVAGFAPGGDSVLRLAGPDAELDRLAAEVQDILDDLVGDADFADIEIVPGDALAASARGDVVVTSDEREAAAAAAGGRRPVERIGALAPAPAGAAARVRELLGWVGVALLCPAREDSPAGADSRAVLRALDEAGLEPALFDVTRAAGALEPETERLLRRCAARRPAAEGAVVVGCGLPAGGADRHAGALVAAGIRRDRVRILEEATPAGDGSTVAERVAALVLEAL